jgi:aconitate decarboxylase
VTVRFPRFEYIDRPQPETGLDGKFSVQYTTAVALLDGEITVDSFTNERRFAPDIAALLPRVKLEMDESIPADFDRMHAIVTVKLKDGRSLTERVAELSGWVGHPLTREQRLKKFNGCARRVLDDHAAARVLALTERLDTLPDVTELMDLVRADGAKR